MENIEEIKATAQDWPQLLFVQKLSRLTLFCLMILIYSTIQAFRVGVEGTHYLFMIVGSVLSVIGAFCYIIADFKYKTSGPGPLLGLLTFGGFIPWAFGTYIAAYQGLWGFAELAQGFSLWVIVKAVVAAITGQRIVANIYMITELAKATPLASPNNGSTPTQSPHPNITP